MFFLLFRRHLLYLRTVNLVDNVRLVHLVQDIISSKSGLIVYRSLVYRGGGLKRVTTCYLSEPRLTVFFSIWQPLHFGLLIFDIWPGIFTTFFSFKGNINSELDRDFGFSWNLNRDCGLLEQKFLFTLIILPRVTRCKLSSWPPSFI